MATVEDVTRDIVPRVAAQQGVLADNLPNLDTAWLTSSEDRIAFLSMTREEIAHLKPLEVLKPVFDRMNCTSKITVKQAEIMKIRLRIIKLKMMVRERESSYNMSQSALWDVVEMDGQYRIYDNIDAMRLKAVTENRRSIQLQGLDQQRRKRWGLF